MTLVKKIVNFQIYLRESTIGTYLEEIVTNNNQINLILVFTMHTYGYLIYHYI